MSKPNLYLSDEDVKNIKIVFDFYLNTGDWISNDRDKEEYDKRVESFEKTLYKIDKFDKSKKKTK